MYNSSVVYFRANRKIIGNTQKSTNIYVYSRRELKMKNKYNILSVYLSPKKPAQVKLLADLEEEMIKTGLSCNCLITTILKQYFDNKKVEEK